MANPTVVDLLTREGQEVLPVALLDGKVVCKGKYPTYDQVKSAFEGRSVDRDPADHAGILRENDGRPQGGSGDVLPADGGVRRADGKHGLRDGDDDEGPKGRRLLLMSEPEEINMGGMA
jgi:hypothetical protein